MSAVSVSLDREQLILNRLPQVHLLARRLHQRCPRQVELDDLISAGTVRLIQAVDRFEPERGILFKTFAERRIRGAMQDYLRQLDPLPRAIRVFVRRRDGIRLLLEREFGRSPDAEEIAAKLDVSMERYRRFECIARAAQAASLSALDHSA